MTRRELLDWGKHTLEENHIVGASVDAWLLFQYVTELGRMDYLLAQSTSVTEEDIEKYKACIKKRAEHYPLQYITHNQPFMGLDFYVDENVLVPRMDTEVLVETVLEYLKADMEVLDLCTGSGCILISLAANVPLKRAVGIDLSQGALGVARTNARMNQVEYIDFIHSDLYESLDHMEDNRPFDVMVSNPPYIASEEILTLMPEVREHEPMMALDGTADGLYFYRKIIAGAKDHLKDEGMIFFEIGWDQAQAVSNLLKDAGFCQIRVKKDLAGLDRVVYAVKN